MEWGSTGHAPFMACVVCVCVLGCLTTSDSGLDCRGAVSGFGHVGVDQYGGIGFLFLSLRFCAAKWVLCDFAVVLGAGHMGLSCHCPISQATTAPTGCFDGYSITKLRRYHRANKCVASFCGVFYGNCSVTAWRGWAE